MEPVKSAPKAPTFLDWFMGALVVFGAVLLVDHLADHRHSPGKAAAIGLDTLMIVSGLIGILYSRFKHRA